MTVWRNVLYRSIHFTVDCVGIENYADEKTGGDGLRHFIFRRDSYGSFESIDGGNRYDKHGYESKIAPSRIGGWSSCAHKRNGTLSRKWMDRS